MTRGVRVVVTGGRKYSDRARVFSALNAVAAKHGVLAIIEGGATGADALCKQWASWNGCECASYTADWDDLETQPLLIKTRRDGTEYNALAGLIRNQRMIDEGKPDVAVAFPGGRGTADMVRRLNAGGIPTWKVG